MYGDVPPDTDMDAAPVLNPLQATLVEDGVVLNAVGCVMVNERDVTHELASVTVKVYN